MSKYKEAHARPERSNTHKSKQKLWREKKNPNETYSYTAINYCSNSGKWVGFGNHPRVLGRVWDSKLWTENGSKIAELDNFSSIFVNI